MHRNRLSDAEIATRLSSSVPRIGAALSRDSCWPGGANDLAELQAYDSVCARLNRYDEQAQSAWLQSFLLANRGRRAEAEAALLSVRRDRDAARAMTRERGARAALTGAFPALAARLAELRGTADPAALFDAIEWAKGRALDDMGGTTDIPTLGEVQAALRGGRVHYLTLLSGDRAISAVLVSAHGTATAHRVPLAEETLIPISHEKLICPDGRNARTGNLLHPVLDWRDLLGPVMEPVAEALAARRIVAGDTLLISPHRLLHLFPLHELSVDHVPAGTRFAVVRVPCASEVLRRLRAPVATPRCALVLRAPTATEVRDPHHCGAFASVRDALAGALLGTVATLDGLAADRTRLMAALSPDMVLHLMAHGDFMPAGKYLRRSYLLLARPGALASRGTSSDPTEGALTVADLLDQADATAGGALDGAHVTLQACVSGYAAANPQGDSIGLEWAFLLAGAASTLGTHWHVDWPVATRFSSIFYRHWLGKGTTRAEAWSRAGASIRKLYPGPDWAAFSLTGEWR